MVTIIAFIIVGMMVNAGLNREHTQIGFSNWRVGDAPFVSWTGFGKVFVTASFACTSYQYYWTIAITEVSFTCVIDGGTESLGITAGETVQPSKTMPRIVRLVFWRYISVSYFSTPANVFSYENTPILCSIGLYHWSQRYVSSSQDIASANVFNSSI